MTDRTLPEVWGLALRTAREQTGMSLRDLARQVGIDKAHLSRVERGEGGVGDEYRMALAAAVGRRVEEIWTYPDALNAERAS